MFNIYRFGSTPAIPTKGGDAKSVLESRIKSNKHSKAEQLHMVKQVSSLWLKSRLGYPGQADTRPGPLAGCMNFAIETSRYQKPFSRIQPQSYDIAVALNSQSSSTGEWPGSRNSIAGRLGPVQLELDARIASFIRTRETHCWWAGASASSHVDLSTFLDDISHEFTQGRCTHHVQLGAWIVGRSVQSNELGS